MGVWREREEDTGQRGIKQGIGGEGVERNLLRHARGKLSLWQGRVTLLHTTNATADD